MPPVRSKVEAAEKASKIRAAASPPAEELADGLVRLRGKVTAPVCRACGGAGRTSTNTNCHPCEATGLAGGLKMRWELDKINGKGIRR